MTAVVIRKDLRDRRRALTGWAAGFIAMVAVTVVFFPAVEDQAQEFQRLLDQAPPGLVALFGIDAGVDIASPAGYVGGRLFGFLVPLLFLVFGIGVGAGTVAGEEEQGTLELVLAHPITRWRLVLEKAAALVVMVAALGGVLLVALAVGGPPFGVDLPVAGMAAAVAGQCGVAVCFGMLALAVGCITGRRGRALGVTSGVAAATYLLDSLATVADELEAWRRLSPFWWATGHDPLSEGFGSPWPALLYASAAAFLAAGAWAFNRRDTGV